MSNMIQGAYPVFTDIDGNPLEDGYIFIGEPGVDPIANPVSVYWDEALTIAATNIRTKGGYPDKSNVPGRLFVAGTYSILVQNKRGAEVYSAVTFFEAGAEYVFMIASTTKTMPWGVQRISDDTVYATIPWGEIPKQATGVTVTQPTGSFSIRGNGAVFTLDGTFTYGIVDITKEEVTISITKATTFATMSTTHAHFARVAGVGKLTLT